MRTVIIGADGQLGSDLFEVFSVDPRFEVYGLTYKDIQVENMDVVRNVLTSIKPNLILNTAAFHVVPECEKNPDMAFSVNSTGALNIAKIAEKLSAINVYYSTDYVFDGKKKEPYVEVDLPNPLNVYAASKLSGEYFTLNYCSKPYVLRISGIYGKVPCKAKGGNFIVTMIRLSKANDVVKVVNDEILTPTPTEEIAENTLKLISKEIYGLYHFTSEGECSWYEFAKEIFSILELKTPLHPISVTDRQSIVQRPYYSVLENSNYNNLGLGKFAFWRDSLRKFLKKYYTD